MSPRWTNAEPRGLVRTWPTGIGRADEPSVCNTRARPYSKKQDGSAKDSLLEENKDAQQFFFGDHDQSNQTLPKILRGEIDYCVKHHIINMAHLCARFEADKLSAESIGWRKRPGLQGHAYCPRDLRMAH